MKIINPGHLKLVAISGGFQYFGYLPNDLPSFTATESAIWAPNFSCLFQEVVSTPKWKQEKECEWSHLSLLGNSRYPYPSTWLGG